MVRALAIFRPSLIALQMPMSEEDEVFVEKCFQRSLVVSTHAVSHWSRCELIVSGRHQGTGQTRLLQRYPDARMAPDGRDLSCRTRVLHAHWLGEGGVAGPEEVCVRGKCYVRLRSGRPCLTYFRPP